MTALALTERFDVDAGRANTALNVAARFWFAMAMLGQWLFLAYIAAFYGSTTLRGNLAGWNKNKFLFKGYVPGDTAGNMTFAAHALLAAVIAFGGAIQLIPQIRKRAMAFHRWNGRLFLITAFGVSLSGLYLVWVRGIGQRGLHSVAISINAALIVIFGAIAWRSALAHDVQAHRRWALRTYMVANAQWFTRVGFIAWMILNKGQDRGFFDYWDFGCYVVPLAVLELYMRAKDSTSAGARYAMAGGLILLTLLMSLGIFGFTAFTWKHILSKL